MDVRLLGAVEIVAYGRGHGLGPPQRCAVLAVLAMQATRHVSVDTLIDRVWGERPPDSARRALHAHITRIRRTLEAAAGDDHMVPVRLLRRPGGYLLDIQPERVDVHRFEDLVDRARVGGLSDGDRVGLLREALSLWRGEPLAGVLGSWADRARQSLRERHLTAVLAWSAAELAVNNPSVVIGPLSDLAEEYPLSEPLVAMLMRALNAVGRSGNALALYTTTRNRLVEELALEPGPELRQTQHTILCNDADDREPTVATPPARTIPAQLPCDVADFTGRHAQLARLDAILAAATCAAGTTVPICTVIGTAGVGKTALAVFWAHRVADRFPDGQLYINLRGFDPGGSVMDPGEAVRRFLDSLGVPGERVPADPDAQTALYRSELAGRRVLVVLDNARDTVQVRPLLPGAPGCLVVVTSRNQLSGLVAADGAHAITMDLLSLDEARELLARRLGVGRVTAEPAAVEQMVAACSALPLALAIVAARAAVRPHLPLDTFAGELRDSHARLDTLTTDDPHTDVRAVFFWSYQAMTPAAARLFGLLGLHPGPEISAPAAASLAGIPVTAVRRLLSELTAAHLLAEASPGRYTFHDLLRAYATEQAHIHNTGEQRHAATQRVLDHYLHTAHNAARLLEPARDPITLIRYQNGVCPERPASHEQALDWFAAEHGVLLAAVDHAVATGFDAHTWQLACALWTFLDWRGHWHDQVAVQQAAVAAAGRLGDLPVRAHAGLYVARAYTRLSRYDDTENQLRQALDLYGRVGDQTGQAHAHNTLAEMWGRQSLHRKALDHAQQALDLYRAAGHRYGQAHLLNNIGWYHAQLGEHRQALTYCQQSLALHEELGNEPGQAPTWDSLGYVHHHLGHHAEAIACYQNALTLFRKLGHRYYEADTLTRIGDTRYVTDDLDAARDAWREAVTIFEQIDHPEVEKVRTKLAELDAVTVEWSNNGRCHP